ncbi:MAG: protein kinase [Verrucomicrobiae bacterium]|nr:protein kinase [Verrucomicrobiae bacterium]
MAEENSETGTQSRYSILEPLGEGGEGSVFRAWDNQLGRVVALKRLKADADAMSALWQETQILVSLHHPNIVTLFDFGSDAEGPFVVMELLEGKTLDQVVTEFHISVPFFQQLARQVLSGLSAAHAKQVVHRDLKPSNIFLQFHEDQSFTAKILDFGLAKAVEAPQEQTSDQDQSVMGSIYTMSPEQLSRQPIDARSDIYSLGCVFYFCLARRFPYTGDSIAQVMHGHLSGKATPLIGVRPEIPPALSNVIMKMLSVRPENRPTIETIRTTIRDVVSSSSRQTSHVDIELKKSAPMGLIVLIVAVVLVLAGGAIWFLKRPKESTQPLATTNQVTATNLVSVPPPVTNPVTPPPEEVSQKEERPSSVDPLNLLQLKKKIGATVMVEGTVMDYGENRTGTLRYLNFAESYRNSLALVFPVKGNEEIFSKEKLETYVGKKIRVTGKLSEFQGRPQMIVEPDQTIEIIE